MPMQTLDLFAHERNEVVGRTALERKSKPWMAHQRELHGKTNPVRVAAPHSNQREVSRR